MARIKPSKSKNSTSYSIIMDYKRNGKRTTKVIDRIGNYATISELAKNEGIDVDTWLNNYLKDFCEKLGIIPEDEEVVIKKYANRLIDKDVETHFNVGYLFLEDIYYSLHLDKICKKVSKDFKFEFDLNQVLSYLVFSRIIYPASKLKTYELSQKFLETPKYNLNNIYRGLTYLNAKLDYVQKEIYNNSKAIVDRDTPIFYYDCTNYYFDIYEEDDLRKYTANAKDKKSKPVVGMGLFMDGHGFPIAMSIFPGSQNESTTLIPLQKKIIDEYDLSRKKTIICTDAAMCTDDIKYFNIKDDRGFVITQSIKRLKKIYQSEIFEDDGWRIVGDLSRTYKLSDIINNEEKRNIHYETIFYKIIPTETNHVVQDLIVTYQIKYHDYLENVRNEQIKRAKERIKGNKDGKKMTLSTNPNDFRRLIKETTYEAKKGKTKNDDANSLNEEEKQEKKEKDLIYEYSINEDLVAEEAKYDGYYGITTNINDEISDILKISKNRWEIEESFRILKSDFESGDIYLSTKDRITAHFLTCFISLLIYRILEYKLDYKYTSTKIIEKLRNMNAYEEKGVGYSPAYVRDDLTDDLHKIFGFRTDFEIIKYEKFDKILKQVKK